MSIQQEKVEKSVQTHDSSTNNLTLLTNHPENAAAEVANTLVSMATGQQRTNLQDLVRSYSIMSKEIKHSLSLSFFYQECDHYDSAFVIRNFACLFRRTIYYDKLYSIDI